jgi:hypothetical protein
VLIIESHSYQRSVQYYSTRWVKKKKDFWTRVFRISGRSLQFTISQRLFIFVCFEWDAGWRRETSSRWGSVYLALS